MALDRAQQTWPASEVHEHGLCNTCGRPAHSPFRVYDERGKVIAGCIDNWHTGHLVTPSESSLWHNRPEAKKMRAARRSYLMGGSLC